MSLAANSFLGIVKKFKKLKNDCKDKERKLAERPFNSNMEKMSFKTKRPTAEN
jgi:hypothetical protein